MNQAQWDSLYDRMGPFLNNARGPWVELNANFDVARAQAAVARINELIQLYFPGGSPVVTAAQKTYASVASKASPVFDVEDLLSSGLADDLCGANCTHAQAEALTPLHAPFEPHAH